MKIAVREAGFFLRNLSLRVPFRYGIATMTRAPHLVVRLLVEIDGRRQQGFSADNLPPKWFTKDPDSAFRDEIDGMMDVGRHAAETACALPPAPDVFSWWREVWRDQETWARREGYPPLLSSFGVSLVERAVIDAFCRDAARPFSEVVCANSLGLRLGEMHRELDGLEPRDLLPPAAHRSMIVRHTVGLADPLRESEVGPEEDPRDGLPVSLESFIRAQGLTHFKIKLSGNLEHDRDRLREISKVIETHARACFFTLDGNENFSEAPHFRAFWEGLCGDRDLALFLRHLLFVEQPFHRAVALSAATTTSLLSWPGRPAMIIDESDAECAALPTALAGGYAGTSHKNCKGVFRGLASACLLEHRRRAAPKAAAWHLSAEDLTNLGPVALLQDLTVAATLGISHAERNGHHYFAGLSQFPESIQRETLRWHGDLYARHPAGFPVVAVKEGRMQLGSLLDAPFGVGFAPDLAEFTPAAEWRYESLDPASAG